MYHFPVMLNDAWMGRAVAAGAWLRPALGGAELWLVLVSQWPQAWLLTGAEPHLL